MLVDILTEYNFLEHVASDVGVDQRFLPAEGCQNKSRKIALWTEDNLMRLKQSKTNYNYNLHVQGRTLQHATL